jgi:hypothetical protein
MEFPTVKASQSEAKRTQWIRIMSGYEETNNHELEFGIGDL